MSHTETDQKQPTQKTMLERLLPVFTRKLDNGSLDLTDAIPADAYKGCGYHVLAIHPDNGSIHAICYGSEDGEPTGVVDEESNRVFDKFADACSADGYIPVQCMFSGWKAHWIDLYYVDEYYEGCPLLDQQ